MRTDQRIGDMLLASDLENKPCDSILNVTSSLVADMPAVRHVATLNVEQTDSSAYFSLELRTGGGSKLRESAQR